MSVTVHRMVPGRSVTQLRMLVANDRRRIEEMSAAMDSMDAIDLSPSWLAMCTEAEARLAHHQRLLAAFQLHASTTLPAAADATISRGPAATLVTTGATPPASPLHHS